MHDFDQYQNIEGKYCEDEVVKDDGPEQAEIEHLCKVCGNMWVTNFSRPPCPKCNENEFIERNNIYL